MPTVSYNGLVADVREEDLSQGMALLTECSRAERKYILASVKRALSKAMCLVAEQHNFTDQEKQDIANDIGIWFAGETLAGRAEEYRATLQWLFIWVAYTLFEKMVGGEGFEPPTLSV